ncbi:hypothetical protein ONZ45_g6482 [Pleurotus djamor]|nr:hypothetical protein ONZ45_g6482 [Pleurotus djamor]
MTTSRLSHIPLQNLYALLQPITLPKDHSKSRFTNWGQSFTCQPLAVFVPETEYHCELVLELGRREGKRVRAVGVGHSPSDLACTNEYMLRTEKLNRLLEVHAEKNYVVVQAGITLQDLHSELAKHKLAMINVGSISDQTLAGIVTTATHGSGIDFGVMSTHALGLNLLLADGSRVFCSRYEREDLFMATILEPAFRLKECQETLTFDETIQDLDKLVHSGEHVRMWWFYSPDSVRVSVSNRTEEPARPSSSWLWHSLMGYHLVQMLLFIGRFFTRVNVWTCRFASWLVNSKTVGVDVSHAIFNVECRHTTEWAIPYENTVACLREYRHWLNEELADQNGVRPHFPVEIRFSAADDIWLSPSSGRRTCWIGIVQYNASGHMAATSLIAGSLLASKLYLANIKHVPTGRKPTLWGPGRCARCTHVLTTSSEFLKKLILLGCSETNTSIVIYLDPGLISSTGSPDGMFTAGPVSESDFFTWEALICGPKDTPFEGGVFAAKLTFPIDYPLSPFKMKFEPPLFHPNIYPDGTVCISILHTPGDDPTMYEQASERWSPVQSVEKVILSVISMLAEPNLESGANIDCCKLYRDNREEYERLVRESIKEQLGL